MTTNPRMGAWIEGGEARFRVWAPDHERIDIVLYGPDGQEIIGEIPARASDEGGEGKGFFEARVPGLRPGALYKIRTGGEGPFPDPCSRAQPFGVHGPSAVVDPGFAWTDAAWKGLPLEDMVIYEVHVGTATPEGTFDALIPRLPDLRALGVNAIELMPLASFPGRWGWGYDGVSLYAPAQIYGGPEGLQRLVDAAHAEGLAVIIDCVYNHFGPDGNYLRAYAKRYFTDRIHTPWGDALNVDGEDAAPVREFFLANTEMWIRDYHADGLRLDAAHEIHDRSTPHLLQEIAARARAAAAGRQVVITAEDDRNEARLVTPATEGGVGLDAVWADDFHHQLRVAFAGDREGYFESYAGTAEEIAATLQKGWFYEGQVSPHHKRPRGTRAEPVSPPRFVHCIQNHDQVGNRAVGDRLGAKVSPAAFRAMSAILLLGPYTPLLFMGQEWNASTPFQYFTDHNPELGRLVTEGRRKEFAHFKDFAGEVPDPQAEATFLRSKLDWSERERPEHAGVLAWYRELLALRARHPAMRPRDRASFTAAAVGTHAIRLDRWGGGATLTLIVNVSGALDADLGRQDLRLLAYSDDPRFGGDSARPPLEGSNVRLAGPAALILEGT